VIPRPPYLAYEGSRGLLHRWRIESQGLYSGNVLWGTRPDLRFAYFWQPHDVVLPERRFPAGTIVGVPQSHIHSHGVLFPTIRRAAMRKPKRCPVISRAAVTWRS
jgi:hypothetical protein